jgi:hypothetical protein
MAIKRVGHRSVLGVYFKKSLLLMSATIALVVACASGTQAQTFVGSPISLASLTNGGGTILVGDKLFSDFGISGYNASNIFVQGIIENGDDFGIQFQGGFVATDDALMDVHLSYQVNVTNSDNLISGANLSFNGVVVGSGGLAQVTESVYTNMNYLYGNMSVSVTPSSSLYSTNMVIDPPQAQLNLDKDVINYAIQLSYSSISTINQSFVQVPEPSTIALAGAGLAGLLILRRRRH